MNFHLFSFVMLVSDSGFSLRIYSKPSPYMRSSHTRAWPTCFASRSSRRPSNSSLRNMGGMSRTRLARAPSLIVRKLSDILGFFVRETSPVPCLRLVPAEVEAFVESCCLSAVGLCRSGSSSVSLPRPSKSLVALSLRSGLKLRPSRLCGSSFSVGFSG